MIAQHIDSLSQQSLIEVTLTLLMKLARSDSFEHSSQKPPKGNPMNINPQNINSKLVTWFYSINTTKTNLNLNGDQVIGL